MATDLPVNLKLLKRRAVSARYIGMKVTAKEMLDLIERCERAEARVEELESKIFDKLVETRG